MFVNFTVEGDDKAHPVATAQSTRGRGRADHGIRFWRTDRTGNSTCTCGASKQGFVIVDVTKPEKPNLFKRIAQSDQATAGNLERIGPDAAIAQAPAKTSGTLTSNTAPPKPLGVLDLSNPRTPRLWKPSISQ